jgi:hypothetical protein
MTVTCTQLPPATNFERPDPEQLKALRRVVLSAHPWLNESDDRAFASAFVACGYLFRTPAPVTNRLFSHHVDEANDLLRALVKPSTDGVAFLCACLAHGDVPWRQASSQHGQLLEVGLDPYAGRPCSTPNRWRAILSGEADLLAPVGPVSVAELALPRARYYRAADGRELTGDGPLWR